MEAMLIKIVILFKEKWSHIDKFYFWYLFMNGNHILKWKVYRTFFLLGPKDYRNFAAHISSALHLFGSIWLCSTFRSSSASFSPWLCSSFLFSGPRPQLFSALGILSPRLAEGCRLGFSAVLSALVQVETNRPRWEIVTQRNRTKHSRSSCD